VAKSTDIQICDVAATIESIDYRAPMKFGGRVVTSALLFNVALTVETRSGRRGAGYGSMPLGNVWAWPSTQLTGEQTLAAMRRFAEETIEAARALPERGHPLELTRTLAGEHGRIAAQVAGELSLPEPLPPLAQRVAASPLEAALHDAFGNALAKSSYQVLGPEFVNRDLAGYLTPEFAGETLDLYTTPEPQPRMPLYHLVGALDPLTAGDLAERSNDGLPETLGDWIAADELTHLKIKLNGDDLGWDLARVAAVERVAAAAQAARGCTEWWYSLDFNERCADVQYVLDFLAHLRAQSVAFARVQYLEQPTHRDLAAHRQNRMHAAARIKPVVIDESLVDLESLLLARELGYSGVALKACKGHTEALLMGAAAQRFGLFLCVQDLTCPGASFLHSASLAAHIPTVAAIEGNARQYCPQGNRDWAPRFPGMFSVRNGTVATGELTGPGLFGGTPRS
jgi:L-alanine-DL-glutamate epimerase-like enolase superfamily enzyme